MEKENNNFSIPFKEEDFYYDDSTFEEISREEFIVVEVTITDFSIKPVKEFQYAIRQTEDFESVSEQDRPFIRVGSRLELIVGRMIRRGHGRYRTSFWVVKEYPNK